MSTRQSETLEEILGLLKQHIPTSPSQPNNNASSHKIGLPSVAEDVEGAEVDGKMYDCPSDDNGLQNALGRLCHLEKEKDRTLFCEEAEKILQDVQCVYDVLVEPEVEEYVKDRKGKRASESSESDATQNELVCQREFKRLKGLMSGLESIAVNKKGKYGIYLILILVTLLAGHDRCQ